MKRNGLLVAVAIAVVVIGWLAVTRLSPAAAPPDGPGTAQPGDGGTAGSGADPDGPGSLADLEWEPVWDEAFAMTVVEIVDGDTLRLELDRTNEVVTTTNPISVRLIGIDTPEVHPETECYGPEAETALGRLAPVGATLLVAPDADSWDDYDRRLFYVWREDGVFVNEALALAGFADVKRYPPNTALQEVLQAAEDSARAAGRGLWGACG